MSDLAVGVSGYLILKTNFNALFNGVCNFANDAIEHVFRGVQGYVNVGITRACTINSLLSYDKCLAEYNRETILFALMAILLTCWAVQENLEMFRPKIFVVSPDAKYLYSNVSFCKGYFIGPPFSVRLTVVMMDFSGQVIIPLVLSNLSCL